MKLLSKTIYKVIIDTICEQSRCSLIVPLFTCFKIPPLRRSMSMEHEIDLFCPWPLFKLLLVHNTCTNPLSIFILLKLQC